LGCLAEPDLAPVACDGPHAAEFAGAFVVARDTDVAPRLATIAPDRCRAIVTGKRLIGSVKGIGAKAPRFG
jgi:hypothetical protein